MTTPSAVTVPPMDAEGQRLLARLPDWLPDGAPTAVLVTVWACAGSTPRGPGARMLVRAGRLVAGTIGGGHLEEEALREATDWATHGPTTAAAHWESDTGPRARLAKYTLGSQLGQCCGGVMWLHFAEITPADARMRATDLAHALATHTPLQTTLADQTLREQPQPLPTVLIFGAGHVGTALSRVLQSLPWRVVVVDHRDAWADPVRFAPGVEVVRTEPLRLLGAWGWLGPIAQASEMAKKLDHVPPVPVPSATRALVMTHDHALDRDLTEALLRLDPPPAFVGLIGSQTKIATTHQRLRKRGVSEAALARLHAPIGLRLHDQMLGGKLPGEIAIAVAAQLLAHAQGLG